MKRILPLPLFLVPLLMAGQEGPHDHGYGLLTDHLSELYSGRIDADLEGANAGIKRELGAILGSDSAFTASFNGVPMDRVDAPDGSFRLFTWRVSPGDGSHLFEGMLLVAKGNKQQLFELRDMTASIARPTTTQLSPENWYGATYYDVVPVKRGGRTYYTLLGWKGFSTVETRKVIDVLDLNGNMPKFGAPLFPGGRQRQQRMIYGFSAQASMLLRWEPSSKMIVLDHLSPIRPEFDGQPAFMAPDLSYDSFTWDKDHWRYERDIDARGKDRGKPYKAPPKEGR